MTTRTHIADEETGALAGVSESSSRSAWAETSNVISFPVPSAAASWDAGEGELDEDVFPLGSLAVRMVADFKRPRILVWSAPEGPREEDPNPPEL